MRTRQIFGLAFLDGFGLGGLFQRSRMPNTHTCVFASDPTSVAPIKTRDDARVGSNLPAFLFSLLEEQAEDKLLHRLFGVSHASPHPSRVSHAAE